MPFLRILKFRPQTFHFCLFIAGWQATQKSNFRGPQEKPREILEQISGIPGLRSIVDNFDIAVESWL